MESIGAYLKKERESKGVTLEEIANSTHISQKFLKAIESDEFVALPNQTTARGFLRSYAKCICIDSNEIINTYTEHMKGFEQNKIPDNTFYLKKKSKFKPVILGLILTAIFIFVYSNITNPVKKKTTGISTGSSKKITVSPVEDASGKNNFPPEVQNTPVKKFSEEVAIPDQKPIESSVVIEKVEQKTEQLRPEISAVKVSDAELVLTVDAKEEAWLNIVIDDVEIKDVILHPGEKIKWKAMRSFLFSSGNKKGIDVFLQGNLLTFPEPQNRIIKNFMIDRSVLNKEIPIQAQ